MSDVCVCCLIEDGDEDNHGVAVDPTSGLCLHCQPCPHCERFGTDCTDRYCEPRSEAETEVTE